MEDWTIVKKNGFYIPSNEKAENQFREMIQYPIYLDSLETENHQGKAKTYKLTFKNEINYQILEKIEDLYYEWYQVACVDELIFAIQPVIVNKEKFVRVVFPSDYWIYSSVTDKWTDQEYYEIKYADWKKFIEAIQQ